MTGTEEGRAVRAELAKLRAEVREAEARLAALERDAAQGRGDDFQIIPGPGMEVARLDDTWYVSAIPSFRYIEMPWLSDCFEPAEEASE